MTCGEQHSYGTPTRHETWVNWLMNSCLFGLLWTTLDMGHWSCHGFIRKRGPRPGCASNRLSGITSMDSARLILDEMILLETQITIDLIQVPSRSFKNQNYTSIFHSYITYMIIQRTYVCTYVYAYINIKVTDLGEHWYPLVVLASTGRPCKVLLFLELDLFGFKPVRFLSAGSRRVRDFVKMLLKLITDWVGWISLGFGCVCFYDKMHATDLCGRFFCLFQGLILSMGAFLCTSNLCRWITASLGMCPSANSHLQSDVVEKHGTNTVGQS